MKRLSKAIGIAAMLALPCLAQIDPSIPLRVNPPAPQPNIFDTYRKLQQIKLQQQQIEENQRIAAERARLAEQEQARKNAQSAPPQVVHVKAQELMTPEVYAAIGIATLNANQQLVLDGWLSLYTFSTFMRGLQSRPPTLADDAIESRIDGDFSGWDGDTVFKLENGQSWKQSSYAYTYHFAFSPRVVIFQSGASFKMKVDDVDDLVGVTRVR